jgi:hypothetical protein
LRSIEVLSRFTARGHNAFKPSELSKLDHIGELTREALYRQQELSASLDATRDRGIDLPPRSKGQELSVVKAFLK